jgi:hypothetical protein
LNGIVVIRGILYPLEIKKTSAPMRYTIGVFSTLAAWAISRSLNNVFPFLKNPAGLSNRTEVLKQDCD